MGSRKFIILLLTGVVLATMLACNITTVTPSPEPGVVTDSPEAILPPPAAAFLRVAYIKSGNVWIWTEGGSSMQLTYSGDAAGPKLSSDGLLVAYNRNGELWEVNADGSGERVLVDATYLASLVVTPGDSVVVNTITWFPGTHILAFDTLTIAGEAGYRIQRFDLNSLNADGAANMVIALRAPNEGGIVYFSPDLTTLALVQPGKVLFLGTSGAYLRDGLSFPTVLTYSEWMYVPTLVWLPDSSGVRVVVPAHDPLGDPSEVTTVWDVPVSGTASVLDSFIAAPAFASSPVLSPDARKVLYLAPSGGNYTLQVREFGGLDTGFTYASAGEIGIVDWSPDSIRFVYWLPMQANTYLGALGAISNSVSDTGPNASSVRWIDENRVIYIGDGGELRYRPVDGTSSVIDSGVSGYDLGRVVY
jgi:hypothetical protein